MYRNVSVSIQPSMCSYICVFFEKGSSRSLRIVRLNSEEKVRDLMNKSRVILEDRNLVENALAENRPVIITLRLDEEHYRRLTGK